MSNKIKAYGAESETSPLREMTIERREVTENDVKIKITYCGVCHSDIHTVENDWEGSNYPVVPGHEIIGRVVEVGSKVSKFKKDQLVGVGCMVDSCRTCGSCKDDLEQYCENGATFTYNSKDSHLGGQTYGGYSQMIVVDQDFVLDIPENLDEKSVAPLLCAGITTFSPLNHWKVGKGDKVGVIGLGGLGHMGIKFAHAMGAEVVLITRSKGKIEDAESLGADSVLLSTDANQFDEHKNSFDFLLNTIPVKHDLNPYLDLLKRDGTMVLVGAIEKLEPMHGGKIVLGRKRLAGSLIGGIKETQEMLDFCGENDITCDVEMISIQTINDAYKKVKKGDVKYRFVIDMDSLKN